MASVAEFKCVSYNNNNHGSAALYMGSGLLLPPLSEVTGSCAFVAVGDWKTGRAAVLSILMRRQSHLAGSQETWVRHGGV
jgi:hypothetical protein